MARSDTILSNCIYQTITENICYGPLSLDQAEDCKITVILSRYGTNLLNTYHVVKCYRNDLAETELYKKMLTEFDAKLVLSNGRQGIQFSDDEEVMLMLRVS